MRLIRSRLNHFCWFWKFPKLYESPFSSLWLNLRRRNSATDRTASAADRRSRPIAIFLVSVAVSFFFIETIKSATDLNLRPIAQTCDQSHVQPSDRYHWDRYQPLWDRNQRLGIGTRSLRSVPNLWNRYQLSGIGTRGWKSRKNDFKLQNSTFWSPTLL